jgi:hypothetical protein
MFVNYTTRRLQWCTAPPFAYERRWRLAPPFSYEPFGLRVFNLTDGVWMVPGTWSIE